MRCVAGLLLISSVACTPAKPLDQAILGRWEVWCRTDSPSTDSCLGREDHEMFKVFHPNGRVESGSTKGSTLEGTWKLEGGMLMLDFSAAGFEIREAHRAKVKDDRLILWSPTLELGSIHGRSGAKFEAADAEVTDGERVQGQIDGVRFSLGVPAGYRIVSDHHHRMSWGPAKGQGLIVEIHVSPRAQTEKDGKWVTVPCDEYGGGGFGGSSMTVDGVERDISVSQYTCLEGGPLGLMCSVEHTRGFLRSEAEQQAGRDLCTSLKIER